MLTAEPIHPRLGPGVASVAVDISLAFTKFCTIITAILSSTRINTRLSGAKPHSQSSYPKPGSRSSQPRAGGGVSTPPQRQDHEGTVSRTVTLPSRPPPHTHAPSPSPRHAVLEILPRFSPAPLLPSLCFCAATVGRAGAAGCFYWLWLGCEGGRVELCRRHALATFDVALFFTCGRRMTSPVVVFLASAINSRQASLDHQLQRITPTNASSPSHPPTPQYTRRTPGFPAHGRQELRPDPRPPASQCVRRPASSI